MNEGKTTAQREKKQRGRRRDRERERGEVLKQGNEGEKWSKAEEGRKRGRSTFCSDRCPQSWRQSLCCHGDNAEGSGAACRIHAAN